MNISYTIKALDRFSKTHAKLERQLAGLHDMTKGISEDKDIDVDAHTASANKDLAATAAIAKSIPERIWIKVKPKGFNQGLSIMDNFATKLRTMEEVSEGFARGTLWTFIPTIGSALGIAAAGAGAFAAGLIGAAAAAGAFAMVAVPAISYLAEIDKEVKRGSKEWYELSEATRSAVSELDNLRSAWSKMQDKFRDPVLEVFKLNLQGARVALKMFTPVIEGAVDAAHELSAAFNRNLMSDDVKAIFEWMGKTAGPYLETYGKAIGNFLVGFMNMMVAFDPLAQQFADGFLEMSENFREWSSTLENNPAFQNFLDYARENGPILLEFLGNLIRFLVDLGIAMAPVGEYVMDMANSFFQWSSEMLETHPMVGKILAVLITLKGLLGLLAPVISIVTMAWHTLGPVLLFAFKWLGKLGVIMLRLGPIITRVGVWVLRLGGPLGWIISTVIFFAQVIWENWDAIWKWTKDTFAKIKNFIQDTWAKVETAWQVIGALKNLLVNKFKEMVGAVQDKMAEIKGKIEDKWQAAQDFLTGIDLFAIGADIISGLVKGIKSIDVWSAVSTVGSGIKSAFTSFFSIHSPSRLMEKDVGKWITLGVIDGMVGMASKAEREANVVANAIARPFQTMDRDFTYSAVGTARSNYANSRSNYDQQQAPGQSGGLTQNLHFYGEAANSPAATARKNRQALRDYGMEANF
ncbi:phage tail protein [Rossellomorea marisflavi]|uniref:phage tail protein n=1 Tax=Rossellomorea marisflavi TaxID=189381 RepID=UPI00114F3FD6|nr:hypothetical protein [Rossellomorea marisflavi]